MGKSSNSIQHIKLYSAYMDIQKLQLLTDYSIPVNLFSVTLEFIDSRFAFYHEVKVNS